MLLKCRCGLTSDMSSFFPPPPFMFSQWKKHICVCLTVTVCVGWGGGGGGKEEFAGLLFPVGLGTFQFVFNHRVTMHRVPQALLVIN